MRLWRQFEEKNLQSCFHSFMDDDLQRQVCNVEVMKNRLKHREGQWDWWREDMNSVVKHGGRTARNVLIQTSYETGEWVERK
jgi:hypothetical protein